MDWLSVRCLSCGEWVTVGVSYEKDTGAWEHEYPVCECGHQIDDEDMAESDVEPGEPPEPLEPPDWSTTA